jgi:hypothetical protein
VPWCLEYILCWWPPDVWCANSWIHNLGTFGPNAEYCREGVFTANDHCNSTFEMQQHNIGRVRQKQLILVNEKLITGQHGAGRHRRTQVLNELSQNLHLADAHATGWRNVPNVLPVGILSQGARCSVMDKAAFVGKNNSTSWNQWYRTLGNQSHHDVQTSTAGFTFKLNRELQEDIPPPSRQVVYHLSIWAVFFSSEAVEFMTRPTSAYRSKNLQNMQIPSPDNNIVEVQLIERGGNLVIKQYDMASAIDREVTTTFLHEPRQFRNGWKSTCQFTFVCVRQSKGNVNGERCAECSDS